MCFVSGSVQHALQFVITNPWEPNVNVRCLRNCQQVAARTGIGMNEFDGIIVLATRENILYVAVIAVCRVRVLHDKMKLIVDQIKLLFVTVY